MNIFVLDNDAWSIPEQYCNIHVNKMLLETCQLLCSVFDNAPYKRTHYNHPCAKWARQSKANWEWLLGLANALSAQYTKRTGKIHGCDKVVDWLNNNDPDLPDTEQTDWPQCMPDEYKGSDSIEAYRRYYAYKLADFKQRGLIK